MSATATTTKPKWPEALTLNDLDTAGWHIVASRHTDPRQHSDAWTWTLSQAERDILLKQLVPEGHAGTIQVRVGAERSFYLLAARVPTARQKAFAQEALDQSTAWKSTLAIRAKGPFA